jgi:RimJ/RimL family protein N-acetyltransferase
LADRYLGPAYRIHTKHLVVRCWDPRDAVLLKKALDESAEHLKPWMPWAHDEPEDLEEKIARLRGFRAEFDLGQDYTYGIFDRDETEVLGAAGLHTRVGEGAREVGYWVHKDHVNRGIATEAAAALVRVHEATLRKRKPFFGELRDQMVWTLFSEEYPGSPAADADVKAYDAVGRRIL